jgi:hypothetical protein
MSGCLPVQKSINRDYGMCVYSAGVTSRRFYLNMVRDETATDPPTTPSTIDTTFVISNASANEGDSISFPYELYPALTDNFTFSFATYENGTAYDCTSLSGNKRTYKARTGSVTILAGSTSGVLKIGTCHDTYDNPSLWFTLNTYGFSIPAVRNALTDSIAVGTILDIDVPVTPSTGGDKRVKGVINR